MPDANDAPVPAPTTKESTKLPFTTRRFLRGLSHDVGKRRHLKLQHVAAAIVIVAGGTWAATEIHERITHVYEYDARITGNLITVSSRVAGWVTNIAVTEGAAVSTGQVLIVIDSRESKLQLRELESRRKRIQADRARMVTERGLIDQQTQTRYQTLVSARGAAAAAVAALDPQLDLAKRNLSRANSLFEKKVIPRRQLDEARTNMRKIDGDYRQAVAVLQQARARLLEAKADRARLDVLDGENEMLRFEEAELQAKEDQQKLDISDRVIRAPVNGLVDKTFVETGEYVTPGQRLAIVHDPTQIWIEANIKETEIRKLKIGQPVEVLVDAYPDHNFIGKVAVIGSSTTSEFALLPTPNPSGNFTKITQRLPVRIAIDQQVRKLRPGMMVEVNIDIRGR